MIDRLFGRRAYPRLEPDEGKLSSPVLRGGRGGNAAPLPDYRAFANGRGSAIELAGCWAHVRRKFYEARESSPRLAGWLLGQIQQLYRIEARLREHHAGPALREAIRASQSRPIVKRIERALIKLKASGRHLPQSPLGTAMDYALGQWPTLEIYLGDGRVEIDNNLVNAANGINQVMPRPGLCSVAE